MSSFGAGTDLQVQFRTQNETREHLYHVINKEKKSNAPDQDPIITQLQLGDEITNLLSLRYAEGRGRRKSFNQSAMACMIGFILCSYDADNWRA